MECYQHPATNAVGICRQCGRAGCRNCLQAMQGVLQCNACRDQFNFFQQNAAYEWPIADGIAASSYSSSVMSPQRDSEPLWGAAEMRKAKRSIIIGWVFMLVVGGFCATEIVAVSASSSPNYLLVPVSFYAAWALYWGWRPVWQGWRNVTSGIGCFATIPVLLVVLVLFFFIPLLGAMAYGALGGGIHEYDEARKAARGIMYE